ncbi:histone deacetylase family protein [Advenella faeciporci]|nr:histone deacetylase family protein [Advenella faeciporci]
METLYITHPNCRLHMMQKWHPEAPARLDEINDRLLASGVSPCLRHLDAPNASDVDVLRVHTPEYLAYLKEHVPREGYFSIDNEETSMNPHTLRAAYSAAGAGILAIDEIMAGHALNAFCAVRPPGHHAERGRAMGFCFFNNLAIAARYAIEKFKLKRIAVIDFDVHHGNGTEDIFKNDPHIVMCSFFQYPLYPNCGIANVASNMFNTPVPAFTKSDVIRNIVQNKWLPVLEDFKPEMVLISAGFDAHREDEMGQMDLVEKDYEWITKQLMEVAKRHSQGRIISFLEGGYSLSALGRSVTAHIKALASL